MATGGAPLAAAEAAAVLVHGRGGTAAGIVGLADEFYQHGLCLVAPQAERNRWYPHSAFAAEERNEPWISSGLDAIEAAIEHVVDGGVPPERTLLVGISQGACLVSEFLARNPRRYGGAGILSGGLLGSDVDAERYEGSLDGTPVLVGCSDDDEYVPLERVHATADVFEKLEADVTERIYEGMGHGINEDELDYVRGMVADLVE